MGRTLAALWASWGACWLLGWAARGRIALHRGADPNDIWRRRWEHKGEGSRG